MLTIEKFENEYETRPRMYSVEIKVKSTDQYGAVTDTVVAVFKDQSTAMSFADIAYEHAVGEDVSVSISILDNRKKEGESEDVAV